MKLVDMYFWGIGLQIEEVINSLKDRLNNGSHMEISFEDLKQPGRYSDDEVRGLLHEIKAKQDITKDGKEFWCLLARGKVRIKKNNEQNA
jgi:hypothetical protein